MYLMFLTAAPNPKVIKTMSICPLGVLLQKLVPLGDGKVLIAKIKKGKENCDFFFFCKLGSGAIANH